jgi:hypothetical protein
MSDISLAMAISKHEQLQFTLFTSSQWVQDNQVSFSISREMHPQANKSTSAPSAPPPATVANMGADLKTPGTEASKPKVRTVPP